MRQETRKLLSSSIGYRCRSTPSICRSAIHAGSNGAPTGHGAVRQSEIRRGRAAALAMDDHARAGTDARPAGSSQHRLRAAHCLLERHKNAEAQTALKALLDPARKSALLPTIQYDLATAVYAAGDPAGAAPLYEAAIKGLPAGPESATAFERLGHAYLDRKRFRRRLPLSIEPCRCAASSPRRPRKCWPCGCLPAMCCFRRAS